MVFLEDWRKFGNLQKFGKFLKLGVALILRSLSTDLLIIKTKLALLRSGPNHEKLLAFHLENKTPDSLTELVIFRGCKKNIKYF